MYRYLDHLVAPQEELRGLLREDLNNNTVNGPDCNYVYKTKNTIPNQNQFERFMVSVIFMDFLVVSSQTINVQLTKS